MRPSTPSRDRSGFVAWMRVRRWLAMMGLVWVICHVSANATAAGLEWDAREKSYTAKEDEEEAELVFSVTNRSEQAIEIKSVATSCNCTVGVAPRQPWIIAPGGADSLRVRVDLRSRRGGLTKTVYVDTTVGEELLRVHVQVPPPPAVRREMNQLAAKADRQAVLRGDCASCHVAPTVGKTGAELYQTACVICHGLEHRASMVPDLRVANGKRDAAYWEKWIREGAEGTLMPAFDQAHGGSLEDKQIKSLVDYLLVHLPTAPAPVAQP